MLFKATRSRLHGNCDVSARRKRQTDDQLQPLDNRVMAQALNSGRQQIEQVSVMLPVFMKFTLLHFHHISHMPICQFITSLYTALSARNLGFIFFGTSHFSDEISALSKASYSHMRQRRSRTCHVAVTCKWCRTGESLC